jgi:hypothetical protein
MKRDCWDPTIDIVRGANDPPVVWQVLVNKVACNTAPVAGDRYDLTGSDLYLTVAVGTMTMISLSTVANPGRLVIDLPNSKISWAPTLAETRLLPLGAVARYELERRKAGAQTKVVAGLISVSGGINPD